MSTLLALFLSSPVPAIEVSDPSAVTMWAPRAELEMFYQRIDGAEDAVPLVLLHPWGLDHRVWADVVDALRGERPILALDLPAHGRSDRSHTRWSMPRLARSVLDVLDAEGVDRAFIVGNSLGGATALEVARLAPARVRGLVLVAAPGGRPLSAPIQRLARQVATADNLRTLSDEAWRLGLAVGARGTGGRVRDATDAVLGARRDPGSWRAFSGSAAAVLRAVAAYAPDLDSIEAPALVIHGEADPLIPVDLSRALSAGMPRAQLHVLDGCGHLPEIECPDALLEVLGPFLSDPAGIFASAGADAERSSPEASSAR